MEFLVSLTITLFLLYTIHRYTKKKKSTKSNYFLLIDNWQVENGDFVTSGQELANITLCIENNSTERNIKFIPPRNLRAYQSGHIRKILEGNRLYIEKAKNIDEVSFDLDDIFIIE